MAKPWKDVASSNEFQSLTLDEQRAARDEYFNAVVAPRVPKEDAPLAYREFTSASEISPASEYEGSVPSGLRALGQSAVDIVGTSVQGAGVLSAREDSAAAKRKKAAVEILDAIDSTPSMDDDALNAALSDRGLGNLNSPQVNRQSGKLGIMADPSANFDAANASAELSQIIEYRNAKATGDEAKAQAIRVTLDERRAEAIKGSDVVNQPAYRAGASVRRLAEESIPLSDEEREKWYNEYIMTPAGQTIGFAAGSVAGPVGIAGMGALAGGASNYQEDISRGATPEQALDAAGINMLAGTSEAVPIDRMVGRIPGLRGAGDDIYDAFRKGGTKAAGKQVLREAGQGAFEEGVQEGFQTGASNYAAQETYDPERNILEGVPEAAIKGAASGAFLAVGSSALPSRNKKPKETTPPPADGSSSVYSPDAPAPTTPPLDSSGLPEVDLPDAVSPAQPTEDPSLDENWVPPAAPVAPKPVDAATMQRELDAVLNTDTPISDIIDQTDFPDRLPEEELIAVSEGGEGSDVVGYAYLNPATGAVRYPGSLVPPAPNSAKAPAKVETADDLQAATSQAASSPLNDLPEPTTAQKEAGNYKKAHVKVQGFNISIETPKGGERTGIDPDGEKWGVTMPADYGYIKRTEGADGEQVDVFLGDKPTSETAFVIDQFDARTGKFDEHKIMLGFDSAEAAKAAYIGSFSDGKGEDRIGALSEIDVDSMKKWLSNSSQSRPFDKKAGIVRKGRLQEGERFYSQDVIDTATQQDGYFTRRLEPNQSQAQSSSEDEIQAEMQRLDAPALKARLSKLDNIFDRAAFERMAGITLPKGVKATQNAIDSWIGGKMQSPDRKSDKVVQFDELTQGSKLLITRPGADYTYDVVAKDENTVTIRDENGEETTLDKTSSGWDIIQQEADLIPPTTDPRSNVKVTRADIIPTREGVIAVPIKEDVTEPLTAPEAEAPLSQARQQVIYDAITSNNIPKLKAALASPSNPKSRQYFTSITGLELPASRKESMAALDKWGKKQYALAQKVAKERKDAADSFSNEYITPPIIEEAGSAPDAMTYDREPPEEEAPAPEQTRSPAQKVESLENLNELFLSRIREGYKYPSIQQARKDASEALGQPIKPNTEEAKVVDEQIEIANTLAARDIVAAGVNPDKIFTQLVELYESQPILSQRSSTSVENQAYSTPAPIAYLASRLAGINANTSVLEPTAGNGGLLIEANPKNVTAIELDPARAKMLERLFPGMKVTTDDFLLAKLSSKFDRIITNPPFGKIPDETAYPIGNSMTAEIDQAIALEALKAMNDNGKAVLIIGSKRGRSKNEEQMRDKYNTANARLFFKHLYDNYKVTRHFTLDGSLYKRQGAGYPIDIIVIDGKGKSGLTLPGVTAPKLYTSFTQLKELINEPDVLTTRQPQAGAVDGDRPNQRDDGERVQDGNTPAPRSTPERSIDARSGRDSVGEPAVDRTRQPSEPAGEQESLGAGAAQSPARGGNTQPRTPADREESRLGEGREGRVTTERTAKRDVADNDRPTRVLEKKDDKVSESGLQVSYQPTSSAKALDTLVPVKMKAAIDRSLSNIEADVGNIDTYVARELDYASTEDMHKHFAAEQIEALALAIRNIENGAGFIIGDQTGIGKGRVNAAILRYARIKGKTPIFITKEPGLYGDMYRDLHAIGERNFKAFVTNTDIKGKDAIYVEEVNQSIQSLPKAQHDKALSTLIDTGKLPQGFDYLFTTYSQLQPVAGKGTSRHKALESAMFNAVISFDESHEAGGGGAKKGWKKKAEGGAEHYESRAAFARHLVDNAAGVMYSSATYAKSPEVMDLYRKTDIRLAVDDVNRIAETINAGGVPLQQVIANTLVESGQYVRREKSFDGVSMNLLELPADMAVADRIAGALRDIFQFDMKLEDAREELKEAARSGAGALGKDGAISEAGISSTNFASIMHNIVGQALVAQKIKAVALRAVELHKSGKKPVIALSNTNESFIESYMKDAGLTVGDVASGLNFNKLLSRYLERTRTLTEKDSEGNAKKIWLDAKQIGEPLQQEYEGLMQRLEDMDFGDAPISPIDYLRSEMAAAGMRVGEVTGRTLTLDYKDGEPTIASRDPSAAGKKKTIGKFNSGEIDALILNRSGSTGYSMHASSTFKDQSPRHMLILQAEPNIDVYMQMLGRIHRTGQVKLPSYDIVISNIPVERRPAAILMKKLGSLNANTTANKKGATTIDSVVDFMNPYGDMLVVELLKDEPSLRLAVNMNIPSDEGGFEGMASQLTGRLAIMPVKEQARILDLIEGRYTQLMKYLDDTGENVLEAKELDLQAETTAQVDIEPSTGNSPFAGAVRLEQVSAKRIGKPYTMEQIDEKIATTLDGMTPSEFSAKLKDNYTNDTQPEWNRIKQRWENAQSEGDNVDKARESWKRANDLRKTIINFLDTYRVGNLVTLKSDEGNIHGVIIDIGRDKSDSPVALSQFNVKIAVADAVKEITVPLSQVSKRPDSNREPKYDLSPSFMNKAELAKMFEQMKTELRETRYIVTGNLLRGFDKFRAGKIVFFTRKDGKVDQGILMPKTFDANKSLAEITVSLRGYQEAEKLLRNTQNARIVTLDGLATVERDSVNPGLYRLSVNRRGRSIYTSSAVREALGSDMYSRAGDFVQTFSPDKLPNVYKAVEIAGSRWGVNRDQDVIREMRGETKLDMKFQRITPGQNGGTARIAPVKNWTEKRTRIANEILKLAKDRFGDGIRVDFAAKVYDDAGKEVFGAFSTRDNPNGTVEYWVTVSLSEGNQNPVATLNHEGIHYLRGIGAIDDATWSVLREKAYSAWIKEYNIRKLYKDDTGLPVDEDLIVEEAIAEAYANSAKWNAYPQKVRVLFRKIEQFLSAVKKLLVGEGFTKADDIFSNISAGKFANSARLNNPVAVINKYQTNPQTDGIEYELVAWKPTSSGERAGIVARKDGKEIGSLGLYRNSPSEVEIGMIDVFRDNRKQGIATEMVKRIRDLAPSEKVIARMVTPAGKKLFAKFDIENNELKLPVSAKYQRKAEPEPITLEISDRGIWDAITDANMGMMNRLKDATRKDAVRASVDHWRRYMQDRFLHFYRVQKHIEKITGERMAESTDVYGYEEMFSGRAGAKLEKLERRHKDPLINLIADFNNKYGAGVETIEKFLYALHAPERNAQIAKVNPEMPEGGSGMSNEEAEAIIQTAKEAGQHEELMEIAKRVHAMLNESVNERLKMGLINEKTAEAWKQYKFYVPLRGTAEIDPDGNNSGMRQGKGMDIRGAESKRAKGRKSYADNILGHAFSIADEAIIRGEKNRVDQALYRLVKTYPSKDLWEVASPKMMPFLNQATGLIEWRATPMPKNAKLNDFTVGVKVDGVQKLVTLKDKRLAAPMKNLELDKVTGAIKMLMLLNRFLSQVNTTMNPEFVISNAFRDLETATINLSQYDIDGLRKATVRDYFKALKGAYGGLKGKEGTEWQNWYKEYNDAGGKVNFWRADDLDAMRTRLKRELLMRRKGVVPMTIRGARATLEFIEMGNMAIENAIRLSAYANARKRGLTAQSAARLAKNLTVNFNKRGEFATKMNALYLFYNASVQGTFVMLNALKSKRVQRISAAIVAMGFAEHFMNMMLTPQDDDDEDLYDKIPDYIKEGNIIIMDPTGKLSEIVDGIIPIADVKGAQYIKIPMAYGYRVFHGLGRNTAALMSGKQSTSDTVANIASSIVNNFNPIGGSESLLNFLAPTVADPLIDIDQNRNFMGSKIRPEPSPYDKSPPPDSQMYFPNVSDAARWISKELNELTGGDKITPGAIDWSPEVLDYIFEQFTGAAGAFVGRTVDSVSKGFSGEEIDINDTPVLRKMIGGNNPYFDKSAAYDRMSEIENIVGRYKDYLKSGMREEGEALRKENAEVFGMRGLAENTSGALQKIRTQKLKIELNRSYTREQKEMQIKKLEKMETDIVTRFNRQYLKAKKADANQQ